MKSFQLLVILSLILKSTKSWPKSLLNDFESYKAHFPVNFTCQSDENRAIYNFMLNKQRVDDHNRQYANCNSSYSLGLWEYSIYTDSEINKILNGFRPPPADEMPPPEVEGKSIYVGGYFVDPTNLTDFNWANLGAVNQVLDQGYCGSCYAITAVGALEGQVFRKTSNLPRLSAQQVIDCSTSYGNNGCEWGNYGNAYQYIKENGIANGVNYKFRKPASSSTCKYKPAMKAQQNVGYRWIAVRDNTFLMQLIIAIGPLAVSVNASLPTFQNYRSGVYNDPKCIGDTNHAMLLTGFGTDPRDGDYWILRNSYGKGYGENGYIRMTRQISNMCGIFSYVMFPIYSYS